MYWNFILITDPVGENCSKPILSLCANFPAFIRAHLTEYGALGNQNTWVQIT